jgi:hypothetical protein
MRAVNILLTSSLVTLAAALACGGSDNNTSTTGAGGTGGSGGTSTAGTGGANGGGTGGSGQSGGFMSSLPGSSQIGTLSMDQLQTLCDEFGAYSLNSSLGSDTKEITCRFSALLSAAFTNPQTDSDLQAACQTAYDSCTTQSQQDMCNTTPDPSCTATVAEYTACVNDATALLHATLDSIPSCSEVTLADLDSDGGSSDQTMTPASCQAVENECPSMATPGSGN